MQFKINFDDAAVQAGLEGMRYRGSRLHEVFKALRPELRDELKRRAKEESGPEGSWAPRAAATRQRLAERGATKTTTRTQRRKKGFSGPLRQTTTTKQLANTLGRLPGSVTTRVTPRSLIAESKVPWAGIHNEGGTAGRGSRIPARPFVFMSEEFLRQAQRDLADFVFQGWTK